MSSILGAFTSGHMMPPPGMPASIPHPEQGGDAEAQPIDLLKQMIDLAKQYVDVEPDEEDKATMTKVLSTLQQYLAKDQADRAKLLGDATTQRVLRKTA